MKLVRWSFQNLHIPMMEDQAGVLYCTSKGLSTALGLSAQDLKNVRFRYKDRIHPIPAAKVGATAFLSEHHAEFGLRRVGDDALLWPIREALGVAFFVRTEQAWEFHEAVIDLIEEHANKEYITRKDYDDLEARVNSRVDARINEILSMFRESQPALRKTATAIGVALNAQRQTKHLRLL